MLSIKWLKSGTLFWYVRVHRPLLLFLKTLSALNLRTFIELLVRGSGRCEVIEYPLPDKRNLINFSWGTSQYGNIPDLPLCKPSLLLETQEHAATTKLIQNCRVQCQRSEECTLSQCLETCWISAGKKTHFRALECKLCLGLHSRRVCSPYPFMHTA